MKKIALAITATIFSLTLFADAAPTTKAGFALLSKGKHAEAEKIFRAIASRESKLDKYAGTHGLMFALRYQKKNEEVIKEVDAWLKANPDATLRQKASLYIFKGNAFRDLKKVDEALAVYQAGFEFKDIPNSIDCAREYVSLAANSRKYDLALKMFEEAYKEPASKKSIPFLISCANLMWKTNKGDIGIKLLTEAESLKLSNSQMESLYRHKGYIYRDCIKNQEEAVKAFEKALAVPGIRDIDKAILWNNIGLAYEKDDDYEKAVEAFKKVGTFNAKGWFIKSAENSAKRLQKKIDAGE